MIKVFWHQSDNFGDKLTPYFLDKLGIKYEYVDKDCKEDHYIICGSIFSACNENSIIWGARAYGIEAEFYMSNNVIGQDVKIRDAMSYEPNPDFFLSVCPIEEIKQKLQ